MKRLLLTIALLLAINSAARADLPHPGELWALEDSPDGPEVLANIEANKCAMGLDYRMPIRLTHDGKWRPNQGDVLLQVGHTYAGDLETLNECGRRPLVFNILLHTKDQTHNGTNYHCSQGGDCGPDLNRPNIVRMVGEIRADLAASYPDIPVRGVQIGNELYQYCPTDCPDPGSMLSWYLGTWDAVIPIIPASWDRIDGGVLVETNATKQQANSRKLIVDRHCNGDNIAQCRTKIREGFEHSDRVGVYENRIPGTWLSNKVDEFYAMCVEEGCEAFHQMFGRNSGRPPLSSGCDWGVQPGGKKNRNGVGGIGCYHVVNNGSCRSNPVSRAFRFMRSRLGGNPPTGCYDNIDPFIRMAGLAGTLDPSWVFLPWVGEGEDPPPPPDGQVCNETPKGMHQWCAQHVVIHREFLGMDGIPNPSSCKSSSKLQELYCGQFWQVRHEGSYTCPDDCPGPPD